VARTAGRATKIGHCEQACVNWQRASAKTKQSIRLVQIFSAI
jgi:hypothetical protein